MTARRPRGGLGLEQFHIYLFIYLLRATISFIFQVPTHLIRLIMTWMNASSVGPQYRNSSQGAAAGLPPETLAITLAELRGGRKLVLRRGNAEVRRALISNYVSMSYELPLNSG